MRDPKLSSARQRRYLAAWFAATKSQGSKPAASSEGSKRWRALLLYAVLFGIPLLILNPYKGPRPDAEFQAKIQTQAVSFVAGPNRDAGLLVKDQGRVDISFDGFEKVDLPSTEAWNPASGEGVGGTVDSLFGGSVRFRNVDLRRLATPAGTQVTLLWYEASKNGVTLRLFYGVAPRTAMVALDEQSTVEFRGSRFAETGDSKEGTIHILHDGRGTAEVSPRDGRLNVSVTPYAAGSDSLPHLPAPSEKPTLESTLLRAIEQEKTKPAALPPEDHVALLPGSGVSFLVDGSPNGSAVVGDSNAVQIRNAERTETVLRGQSLEINKLTDRTRATPGKYFPSEISFQVKDDGILVNVLGRGGGLWIDGNDVRPSLAEYLRADKMLTIWLTTGILLGGYLVTILARTKLVKLD